MADSSADPTSAGPEPVLPGTATADASTSAASVIVGPYHLIQLIGQGGMGEVWLAEQKQPVRRRVAVKLIKTGMDTREVVARFESERQALALMDHPAIAKVFDAGSTAEGRPYFVMEYVAGQPITSYCDRNKLSMRQRMELFIQVCEGVQHAHQKAIIHRDLKPSNILVTEVDGRPVPRIIDFGVAKATSQGLSAGTMYTQFGAVVGTLGYMSPEQADSTGLNGGFDIDTRSDVYSLGVILYQLLVGALPLDFKALAYDEVLRSLREDDAPRPSTKLRTESGVSAENAATIAKQRSSDLPSLTRQLRGDPDAITLKALEKDRRRRYASPSEMAADIGHYLRNEPVTAHSPGTLYRARKYVRRHRIGVSIAAAALLLLVGFAITQAFELRRIRAERDRADRITEFMTGMFKVSDPSQARGNEIKVREVLDKAAAQAQSGLAQDPEVQSQVMLTMGVVYNSLGLYPQAESLIRPVLAARTRRLGAKNHDTLEAVLDLVTTLEHESKYAEAEKLDREALDIARRREGKEALITLQLTHALALLATDQGRYAEGEQISTEALEVTRRKPGANDPVVASLTSVLAIDLAYQGKYARAETQFRAIYQMNLALHGPDYPSTLKSENNLGSVLMRQHKLAEAEKTYLEVVSLERRVLGADHPDTLKSEGNLAMAYRSEKRYAEAEKLFLETLEAKRRKLGPDDRSTLVTQGNLADTYIYNSKFAEAEELDRQTFDAERRTLGSGHSDTLATENGLATAMLHEGKYAESEKLFRAALAGYKKAFANDNQDTALTETYLGESLAMQGKKDEAIPLLQEAVDHGLMPTDDLDLLSDVFLKPLQGDPRFEAILADARTRANAPPAKQE